MEDRKGSGNHAHHMKSLIPILFFLFLFLFPFSVPKRPMCCCIRGHSQGREAATDTGWSRTTKILTIVPLVRKKSHQVESFFLTVHMYVLKGNRK